MKERPILMSAPMVKALLEGRKTQTRRIMKPQPQHLQFHQHRGVTVYEGESRMWCWKDLAVENIWDFPNNADRKCLALRAPQGKSGDRLWVKETWANFGGDEDLYQHHKGGVAFRATWDDDRYGWPEFAQCINYIPGDKWRPSIFMPRWASRITLEIIDVRVERLQEISECDCTAEGVALLKTNCDGECGMTPCGISRQPYISLWESINGAGSWELNPFVFAISFKVL